MFIDFTVLTDNIDRYMIGFGGTVAASVISLIASFILGTMIAVFRITPFKPLQWFGAAYVEFIRNIPLLLIAFFVLVKSLIDLIGLLAGTSSDWPAVK